MLRSFPNLVEQLPERLRGKAGERATGALLALLAEALLILVLLTLNFVGTPPKKPGALVSVSIRDEAQPAPEQTKPRPEPAAQNPQRPREMQVPPLPDAPVAPASPPPTAIIPRSAPQVAQFDLRSLPQAAPAPKPRYGPADSGSPGDSKRVGTAPNGEPLYAAAWYREPYDSELAGYLSTADGPGWGLIACRTVPEFRVEDCVGLDEYPAGSRIEQAVLAAAWQFRVRPPRLGGALKYGEWVRIRIDYGIRRN